MIWTLWAYTTLLSFLLQTTSSLPIDIDEIRDFDQTPYDIFNLNIDYFEGFQSSIQKTLDYVNKKQDTYLRVLPPVKKLPLLEEERVLSPGEIPEYVLDYSPLVHLYTEEEYMPCDIDNFVKHFHMRWQNKTYFYNDTLTLQKLSEFAHLERNGSLDTSKMFMTANEDFDKNPEWLTGSKNRPNLSTGKIKDAPAVLIVVDKGNGWVDAYWFYFYAFNLGPFVMGHGPYGNHVGDWEHSLTRFYKGIPVFVWMSAHGGGGAYHYEALEKSDVDERKPVIFSARGTHANYPSTGRYPHDLPFGILSDFTDRGALWDPSKNYLGYTWNGIDIIPVNNQSKINNSKEIAYKDWLLFKGHWGDDKLNPEDPRQVWSPWEWKYIGGPTGPLTKHLIRNQLCQRSKWWNFWKRCPPKKFINLGNGYEKGDGIMCANLFGWIKPIILRKILNEITWGGGLCFIINLIYG